MKNFVILDERKVWHDAAVNAALKFGYQAKRIFNGDEATHGLGFIRPHVDPPVLERNKRDYATMCERLTMIQDLPQVELYENKSGQFYAWGEWMPETWRFTDEEMAIDFVVSNAAPYPLVSKADVGASSVNVRVLQSVKQAIAHVRALFGDGISVEHSSEVKKSIQRGYALFQRFIPHKVTWRVNAIGDARAIFMRYCYRDRPVAQTGNVEPVMKLDDEMLSLLEHSNRFFKHAGTKWCAIDILKEESGWKLLETSLAWPWPSPGKCNQAPFFGSRKNRSWIQMFEEMFDQVEEGAW